MDRIPYIPFKGIHPTLKQEMLEGFEQFYDDQHYILGAYLDKFEQEFASYIGVKHAIGTGNGHDALLLILKCLQIGKGDEVIIPAHTFVATALSVVNAQAKPVLVDIDPMTFNIDADEIEAKISKKTKAIIPVHIYGNPCAMDKIEKIATKYSLHLIEDNAQAQGASFRQRKTGSFGIMSFTSFYPTKNIGALGDAGMIFTTSKSLASKARSLRNYGKTSGGMYSEIGINSRMDDIQAMMLSIKLKYLDKWNEKRMQIADIYQSQLSEIEAIKFQQTEEAAQNVRHIFPILCNKRNELKEYLSLKGIETLIHYKNPIHLHNSMSAFRTHKGGLRNSEKICSEELSLPIYPGLSESEIMTICQELKTFFFKN